MRNTWLSISLLIGAALAADGSASVRAEDITIANFGGAINDWSRVSYWKPFTAETGINVIEDSRDYGIGVVRTKVQGGANTWDVVAVEDIEAIEGCEEGLFEKLDWSKISGRAKLIPSAVLPCAQGELLYSMVVSWDGNRIKDQGPKNWAEFWDVKRWPGKRALYKDPRDSLEAALMADGVARDQVYKVLATPAGVDRAFRKLDQIKSNVLWWLNPGQSRQMLVSGDAAMVATFHGGVARLNLTEHTNLKYTENDGILHTDYWAIVKGTKHLPAAMKFMDFVSRPDKEAVFAANALSGVPNQDATPLIDKSVAPYLPSNPENFKVALVSDPPFWLEHYDALNRRFTAWLAQ